MDDGKQPTLITSDSSVSIGFPKSKTKRDKWYLNWISRMPCVICGQFLERNDPHHCETGGKGIKGSDYSALPLCREHHNSVHAMGRESFWAKHQRDWKILIEAHNRIWQKKTRREQTWYTK